MREGNKIIIKKCKCGQEAEMLVDITGLCYVGCPKCNNHVADLGLKKAVKKWNEFVERSADYEM